MTGSFEEAAFFLAALPAEDRARFSRYAALDLPEGVEGMTAVLEAYAAENSSGPVELLALAGARAGVAGELGFARRIGRSALEAAGTDEERQLAHVCLARTHFQNRREVEDLASFVEHCRAAIELDHAGTFCYERLAALYEYRGELDRAAEVCRRAVEVLGAARDARSVGAFRKRLDRLERKQAG